MSLVLFNDLTRKKESFVPIREGHVGIYACGPTVYDYFHIGNARPFIVFDVLRRWLEHSGYDVTFVQNFTDIDDKMITRAHDLGITVPELAERFIDAYLEDAEALGIRRATVHPKATEHIAEIIALIERIIANGHAYPVDGDVYFDVQSFAPYGQLISQNLDELQSGARVDVDPRKKHPLDFALWKAQKPGEPAWESPWGLGRPGWHIECSAMSTKYLGETIDIHTGGTDLVFPHHENEVAQTEAATGKPFVRYWLHNGYLMIDAEKMSKSLGNFLTAREARKKFSPIAIRFFMLSAHYRSPINFAPEGLEQAKAGADRLRNCWRELAEGLKRPKGESDESLWQLLQRAKKRFAEEMNDDFNTAGALGAVFEAVKGINAHLKDHPDPDLSALREAERFLRSVDEVMGVIDIEALEANRHTDDADEIEALLAERVTARKNKDFARADAIRHDLASRGIVIEDTAQGTRWHRQ